MFACCQPSSISFVFSLLGYFVIPLLPVLSPTGVTRGAALDCDGDRWPIGQSAAVLVLVAISPPFQLRATRHPQGFG
jgi:hypothetical protein